MRSGSPVQLAALRNWDLELQTTSLKRQVLMVQFLSIQFFVGFLQFLLGFLKVPIFCVTLYKEMTPGAQSAAWSRAESRNAV